MVDDDEILAMLVGDFIRTRALADEYIRLAESMRNEIVLLVPPGGAVEISAGFGVRVHAPGRKFSETKARRLLDPDDYRKICVPKPSAALARAMLTPAAYEAVVNADGSPSVRIYRPAAA